MKTKGWHFSQFEPRIRQSVVNITEMVLLYTRTLWCSTCETDCPLYIRSVRRMYRMYVTPGGMGKKLMLHIWCFPWLGIRPADPGLFINRDWVSFDFPVYLMIYAHSFVVLFCSHHILMDSCDVLNIVFILATFTLSESYECLNSGDGTLNGTDKMDKIDWYQTTTKHIIFKHLRYTVLSFSHVHQNHHWLLNEQWYGLYHGCSYTKYNLHNT